MKGLTKHGGPASRGQAPSLQCQHIKHNTVNTWQPLCDCHISQRTILWRKPNAHLLWVAVWCSMLRCVLATSPPSHGTRLVCTQPCRLSTVRHEQRTLQTA